MQKNTQLRILLVGIVAVIMIIAVVSNRAIKDIIDNAVFQGNVLLAYNAENYGLVLVGACAGACAGLFIVGWLKTRPLATTPGAKYCSGCGKEVPPGQPFCAQCGAKQ